MPRHEFVCSECEASVEVERTFAEGPPEPWACDCGGLMEKDWSHVPQICTAACQDANYISPYDAVSATPLREVRAAEARKIERNYMQDLHNKRRMARESGGGSRRFTQQRSIPAHLFHGKIRQTGDKHYWDDAKNMARHDDVTKIQ